MEREHGTQLRRAMERFMINCTQITIEPDNVQRFRIQQWKII